MERLREKESVILANGNELQAQKNLTDVHIGYILSYLFYSDSFRHLTLQDFTLSLSSDFYNL